MCWSGHIIEKTKHWGIVLTLREFIIPFKKTSFMSPKRDSNLSLAKEKVLKDEGRSLVKEGRLRGSLPERKNVRQFICTLKVLCWTCKQKW